MNIRQQLESLISGVLTCLEYPRASEARARCLEEVAQDAAYFKKQLAPEPSNRYTEKTIPKIGWYFWYPKWPDTGKNPQFLHIQDMEDLPGLDCKMYQGEYIGPIDIPLPSELEDVARQIQGAIQSNERHVITPALREHVRDAALSLASKLVPQCTIICDETNNPPESVAKGILHFEIIPPNASENKETQTAKVEA